MFVLDGQYVQVASRLLRASQDLTKGNCFQSANGGPKRAMNISEDMCTERRDLKLLQTKFILLNPRSHSAVITGIVSVKFKTMTLIFWQWER